MLIWQIWWIESLSTVIALLCFIAIIIILRAYENQPLSYQLKVISVNSMISIFSSVLKASLVIPVAQGVAVRLRDFPSGDRC